MPQYLPILTLILVCSSIISIILINRARYKRTILKIKIQEYSSKLKVDESYWYNSSKGFLNNSYPSCWAKVISAPVLNKQNIITVEVLLKTSTGPKTITSVPAASLAKIEQLNS